MSAMSDLVPFHSVQFTKWEFQICPRIAFENILTVDYLRFNNYKTKIIYSLKAVRP